MTSVPSCSIERARSFPLLILLFAGSGAAALIYEIVWFQLLQLVIGSTALSLGVLLGTFMGGMCVGSLGLPRLVSPRHHPLRVYGFLELGIALIGLLVLVGMPYLSTLYVAMGGSSGRHLLRVALPALLLLPPTILMGATLPAAGRWVEANLRGVSWLGFFYAGNIAGAVFGCLLTGFYLLRVYDVFAATGVAAALNVCVALATFGMARKGTPAVAETATGTPATTVPGAWAVYLAIALSGLSALGAQAVWTRVLSLMLGSSTYTFSIILAVFLAGLGLGSSAGSALARRGSNARRDLAICQLLAAAGIAWTAFMLSSSLPYWPIDPTLTESPWLGFQLDLFRSTWAVLPATFFWGASFPLALAAVTSSNNDTGRMVGGVYAANTIGAIIGGVCFSVLFIQWFGTQRAQQVLIGMSCGAALLALWPWGWSARNTIQRTAALVMTMLLGFLLIFSVSPVPQGLIAYGRFLAWSLSNQDPVTQEYFVPNILYAGEGMNASVAVSETSIGIRNFHVSGKAEASTSRRDMRLQRMLGHLPGLLHTRPRSVLIVGLGAGVTAGSFINHPTVERIVICEIEPLIAGAVSKYFTAQNNDVLGDPRVEIIYDDARHYLLTTDEKFDVITSDPIHPWVKGAAALYTREYFELVRRHLNPGGVVSQWVPLYQSSLDTVKSEIATFFEVFSGATVWSNDVGGRGYDIVLLGSNSSPVIDADEVDDRLNRRDHVNVLRSLNEVGFESAMDLLATYAGRHADLAPWLAGTQTNSDRNLRLQYLAGMSLNLVQEAEIYNSILRYRRPPEDTFSGSAGIMEKLNRAMERRRPRTLTATQEAAVRNALATRPGARISVSAILGDPEALEYATQLRQAIIAGGWQVDSIRQSLFTQQIVGLLIFVGSNPPPASANVLFQALHSAGLSAEGNVDPNANFDSVTLVVGPQR